MAVIHLDASAGLPLSYNTEDHTLDCGGEIREGEPRKVDALVPVLLDQEFGRENPEIVAYRMYRDVARSPEHRLFLKKNDLRYDVTILEPIPLGREYNKTLGHYHPPIPGHESYSYPEIYQVLKGSALYLIQKRVGDTITRAYLVKAGQGDVVVIPPGYGHITINPSPEEPLVMANYVSPSFSSEYGPIKQKRGGIWYVLAREEGGFSIMPNPNYTENIEPAIVEPNTELVKGLLGVSGPMYKWPFEEEGCLDFLPEPWKRKELFDRLEEYWERTRKILP